MTFDNSRFTFDPRKNYSGVVMQQGRVQLDADWNEWLAEIARRIQAGTLDIMGHAVYPATTPWAFLITAASGATNTITIGCGRMYIDGLLAENHGDAANAVWDTALAELSATPQPPNLATPNPHPIDFTKQPYYPGATVPTGSGSYLAYLDVWTRPVIYLEDPDLVDKAVGIDSTGRLQTVWQVKLLPLAAPGQFTCATPDSQIPYPANSAGLLNVTAQPNTPSGPCCLTTNTGYTGVENQFYRVEIHQPGQGSDSPTSATATFKWSRDNASVTTGVTAINPATNSLHQPASQLSVMSLGRDQVLGFHNGDYIEILDDWSELWGNSGVLCQIDSVNVSANTITLTSTINTTFTPPSSTTPPSFPVDAHGNTDATRHTRIRRWDQSGIVYDTNGNKWCDLSTTGGAIPVPASDTTLVLESGITVNFALNPTSGSFNTGDFWTFAARTADGSVETLTNAPPRGIHHHYTKLSVVTFSSPASYPDCRVPWECSGGCGGGCCTCTVGDNVVSFGTYSSIQQAVNSLPANGGEVCILPGRYYEYVVLDGLSDIVVRGCGAQTRLASPSMQPGGAADQSGSAANTIQTQTGFPAIVTAVGCEHIKFHSFAVEAADGEVGILLDSKLQTDYKQQFRFQKVASKKVPAGFLYVGQPDSDVTIDGLDITASTLPAIVANQVELLNLSGNRIAMKDVASQWASVYASGSEIHIERNWVGLQDSPNAEVWMPASVSGDVSAGFTQQQTTPLANGGIQIAGPSQDVFICDNEIEQGWRNGISLGNFIVVNANGNDTGAITGLLAVPTDPAANATLQLPSSVTTGNVTGKLAAGGLLLNIQIAGNRIRNMGLCGIGPVGFFNFTDTIEIISIQNLTIAGNAIAGSLQDVLEPLKSQTLFGYGAICIPDAQNLIIRDNTVNDFGATPGAEVCGIFVFNGEQVEIRRNQIVETRDWSKIPTGAPAANVGAHAGVLLMFVTPPPLDQTANQSAWGPVAGGVSSVPLYQPGLPAVTIEHNIVRVPLGLSLEVLGVGPFAIANNQLTSGGAVPASAATGESLAAFLNVAILNLGIAIEVDAIANSFTALYNKGGASPLQVADNLLSNSSSGAVHFTNNHCQLETRVSAAAGIASVAIFSLDHLIFSGNHLWIDGQIVALTDALLLAGSVQVTGNRFQEAPLSVVISGFAFGLLNITAHNIATYCLWIAKTTIPRFLVDTPNVIIDNTLCPK